MTKQLRHPATGRFARAAYFAEMNKLRFVVQDSDGLLQRKQPVAPYLHAFAQQELDRILVLVRDFHAALIAELTRAKKPTTGDLCVIASNRVQALVGQLELEKAKE